MSDKGLIPHIGGLIGVIENGGLSLPFANDIYLYTLKIAGIKYYIDDTLILAEEDKLILIREPNNQYDKYATAIYTMDKKKIGYIPRQNNRVFARLMDGGKLLSAKVKNVNSYHGEVTDIWVRIFLND